MKAATSPQQVQKRRLLLSQAHAHKLTKKNLLVRIFDVRIEQVVATTSLPWQLGHGEWVVKVEGQKGDWSCANLEIVEDVTRIDFEDRGQDLVRWTIWNGRVIESPIQARPWVGAKVITTNFVKGGHVAVQMPGGDLVTIKYPIVKVQHIRGKVVAL